MSGEKSFDLTKVHEVNLKLLKEIDRICRKYKIKYALDSGTLLGAVRHGGFIPWDDDVDVMFTRKNYEMFAKVVRRELPEDMSFVEPNEYHGGKAFYDFISRVSANSRNILLFLSAFRCRGWDLSERIERIVCQCRIVHIAMLGTAAWLL